MGRRRGLRPFLAHAAEALKMKRARVQVAPTDLILYFALLANRSRAVRAEESPSATGRRSVPTALTCYEYLAGSGGQVAHQQRRRVVAQEAAVIPTPLPAPHHAVPVRVEAPDGRVRVLGQPPRHDHPGIPRRRRVAGEVGVLGPAAVAVRTSLDTVIEDGAHPSKPKDLETASRTARRACPPESPYIRGRQPPPAHTHRAEHSPVVVGEGG